MSEPYCPYGVGANFGHASSATDRTAASVGLHDRFGAAASAATGRELTVAERPSVDIDPSRLRSVRRRVAASADGIEQAIRS
jgi:hypothetical protein